MPLARRLAEARDDRLGHARRGHLGHELVRERGPEDRPDEREGDRAADLAEEREVRGRDAELAERHGVLDDDRRDGERGSDAEAGDEHPQPDHRHRGVLGQVGHEEHREAHDGDRADDQPLVAAGPRHDQAGHDRAEDQADHERQGRQAGVRRREALDHLEPAGQEHDRAEEREGGEEDRDHRWPSTSGPSTGGAG